MDVNDIQTSSGVGHITGVIVFKINVDSISADEIPNYLQSAVARLTSPRFEKQGFVEYFMPVRHQPTSITFIDLSTMNSVTV